jgi:hypothetical protein
MVFGKPLTNQAVIRAKLASMISRVESCQNWFESITYQMNKVCLLFEFVRIHSAGKDILDFLRTAAIETGGYLVP